MIQELKNQPPNIIHFYPSDTFNAGDVIKIWLSGQYNETEYNYYVVSEGDYEVTAISSFEYDFVFNEPGTYTISCSIAGKTKKTSIQGNTLTLTIV